MRGKCEWGESRQAGRGAGGGSAEHVRNGHGSACAWRAEQAGARGGGGALRTGQGSHGRREAGRWAGAGGQASYARACTTCVRAYGVRVGAAWAGRQRRGRGEAQR